MAALCLSQYPLEPCLSLSWPMAGALVATMTCVCCIAIITMLVRGRHQTSNGLSIQTTQPLCNSFDIEKCMESSNLELPLQDSVGLPPPTPTPTPQPGCFESLRAPPRSHAIIKTTVHQQIHQRVPDEFRKASVDDETWTRCFISNQDFEPLIPTFQHIPHIHDVGKTKDNQYHEVAITQAFCIWLIEADFPLLLACESRLDYDVSEPSMVETHVDKKGAGAKAKHRFFQHMVGNFFNPRYGKGLFHYYRDNYGDLVVLQAFSQCKMSRKYCSADINEIFDNLRKSIPLDPAREGPTSDLLKIISQERLHNIRVECVEIYSFARNLEQNHENDMLLLLCHYARSTTVDAAICDWVVSPSGRNFYCGTLKGFQQEETMEQTAVRLLGLLSFQRILPYRPTQTQLCISSSYLEDFHNHIHGVDLSNERAILENMAFCTKRQMQGSSCSSAVFSLFDMLDERPMLNSDDILVEYLVSKCRQLGHKASWSMAMESFERKRGIMLDDGRPWQKSNNNEADADLLT